MQIKIRKSVFETNSSSMHSVCISGGNARYADFPNGVIEAEFEGYGWGYDELTSISEKISYVLTCMQYYDQDIRNVADLKESVYFTWLSQMVHGYTGAKIEILSEDDNTDMGYVDHQSSDMLDDYFRNDENVFKENMKELIFNPNISIVIDNDNH